MTVTEKMKVILVAGARPNFMKVAPLMRAIEVNNASSGGKLIEPVLVHTGQHYDYEMSRVFFEDLELPEPDVYLGVGSGSHAEQTGKIMIEFEKVLIREKPDLAVVVGDVNSTLAAALATVKLHIPIAHVEAGPRVYDPNLPEEVNRVLTDHISDYLFTPSPDADENLKREGVSEDKIFFVGNIMVDSLLQSKEKATRSQILARLGLEQEGYAVLTLHRAENVDDEGSLVAITSALKEVSQRIPVIFPIHPRTKKNIDRFGLNALFCSWDESSPPYRNGIYLIPPLGYLDFLKLMMASRFVLTDSGGIQAETTILNIPCLTLYHTTGWSVTVTEGTNTVVGIDPERIVEESFKVLDSGGKKGSIPRLWDGKTAQRIVKIISGGIQ